MDRPFDEPNETVLRTQKDSSLLSNAARDKSRQQSIKCSVTTMKSGGCGPLNAQITGSGSVSKKKTNSPWMGGTILENSSGQEFTFFDS